MRLALIHGMGAGDAARGRGVKRGLANARRGIAPSVGPIISPIRRHPQGQVIGWLRALSPLQATVREKIERIRVSLLLEAGMGPAHLAAPVV